MKVSDIDADFVELIDELVENGFRPFASCDGVEAHHTEENPADDAYIGFLDSPQIMDLMAAFFRDKDVFSVSFGTQTSRKPIELYGNIIEGNRYSVYFYNERGQYTDYFKRIISGVIDGSISISDEEKELLEKLVAELGLFNDSDLSLNLTMNTTYQPYMNKLGKTNMLTVHTKEDAIPIDEVGENGERYVGIRDMTVLSKMLGQKFGFQTYEVFDDKEFVGDEFSVTTGRGICEVYVSNEKLGKIFEIMAEIRSMEGSLPIVKIIDADSIDYEALEHSLKKKDTDEIDV